MILLLEPWSNHYALYNVPRSGQLVGLTVIIIVVIIVMYTQEIHEKRKQYLSTEAL